MLASRMYATEEGFEPMVEVGPYRGVLGTMWSIVKEEGTSVDPSGKTVLANGKRGKKAERKGQGVEGLIRGWRVGMWGLVGLTVSRAMSLSGSAGGEF